MVYKRKTYDEWEIQGNYGYGDGWECVCTEDNRKEGFQRLKEYRENDNRNAYRIQKKRVKINPQTQSV